jgi:hypothetical protein
MGTGMVDLIIATPERHPTGFGEKYPAYSPLNGQRASGFRYRRFGSGNSWIVEHLVFVRALSGVSPAAKRWPSILPGQC